MQKDLNEILNNLRKLQPLIKEKYHISSTEIFGSYVKNNQTSRSDLDILVSFSKVPTLIKFLELENFLSDKLNVKVDLVMKDSLKPGINKYILNNTIII